MNWTDVTLYFIKVNPFSSFALLSFFLAGWFLILWDSRRWLRRLISALAPQFADVLLTKGLRREQDHEYLVSRVMESLDRRRTVMSSLDDKDRSSLTSTLQARRHVK